MKTLVLLRHGESVWNLENRFTGWTDVDLTPKGIEEAREAARSAERRRLHLRHRLHVAAHAGDPDVVDHARRHGSHVAAGHRQLAAERAALRRAAGAEQGRDRRKARRRAGEDLAPQLRHPAAAAARRRPARGRTRSALRFDPRLAVAGRPSRSRTRSPDSCRTGTRPSRRRSAPGNGCSSSRTATACARW